MASSKKSPKAAPAKRNTSANRTTTKKATRNSGVTPISQGRKKTSKVEAERTRPAGRARALAAENPTVPVLALLEPEVDYWKAGWQGNLQWLLTLPGMSTALIADRADRTVGAVHRWVSDDTTGSRATIERLTELAGELGFPVNAWLMPLPEFIGTIRELYPNYFGGVIDGENGSEGNNLAGLRHETPLIVRERAAEPLLLAAA